MGNSKTFNYQGKKVTVTAESLSSAVRHPWQSSLMCPWDCGVPLVVVGKTTAKEALKDIEKNVKNHWDIMHRVLKRGR